MALKQIEPDSKHFPTCFSCFFIRTDKIINDLLTKRHVTYMKVRTSPANMLGFPDLTYSASVFLSL